MSKQLTYEQLLHRFLKHHRVYSKFQRNRNGTSLYYQTRPNTPVNHMVCYCGFDWENTPEGFDYWRIISHKWVGLCNHFNIGNNIYE